MTAATLNCVISGFGPACTGTNIESLLAACNEACETGEDVDGMDVDDCIDAVDCFNNGNVFVDGVCEASEDGCHDAELCNEEIGLCFPNPGPADSPKNCNDARKSDCEVIETDPKDTGSESDCTNGVKQDEESCGPAITTTSASTVAQPATDVQRKRNRRPDR